MKDYADKSWYRKQNGKVRSSVLLDWTIATCIAFGLAIVFYLDV